MPAAEKRHEHQEIKEQFGLRVTGLENENPERDDACQVGGGERRELSKEDHREEHQQCKREIDVGALGNLKERRIGQVAVIEECQVARVKRHPVSLADDDRRLTSVPVGVDVLGIPQVAGLIAARLGRIDAAPVFRGSDDIENAQRRAREEDTDALDEGRNGSFLI